MRWPVQSAVQSGAVSRNCEGSKSTGQQEAESALVGALPQLEGAVLRSFQGIVIGRECGEDHGDLMRVSSDGFKIVLMGEEGVRGSSKGVAEIRCHGVDHVFLPEEAVAAPGSKVCHGKTGYAAQPLVLAPEFCRSEEHTSELQS